MHLSTRFVSFVILVLLGIALLSCDSLDLPQSFLATATDSLSQAEVKTIVSHAVEQSNRLNQKVDIVIVDREGNTLATFTMGGFIDSLESARRKAITASYLSSNGHGFTSLTACFITRNHFPPGISNTSAGPLFGVGVSSLPNSSLPDGRIQPNAGPLNDEPGGVPIFKNGVLVGGIGVSGSGLGGFSKNTCTGVSDDETIALGAVLGYTVPDDKRGDNILIDGIRFLYANTQAPAGNFTSPFDETTFGAYSFGPVNGPGPRFPVQGYVVNLRPGYDFSLRAGTKLTSAEVDRIIRQSAAQAAKTRAAIRRPLGSKAQVFISVVDIDGKVLGIWRTPDATIFSFDVSAQKARTALAFSDPNNSEFGRRIRSVLGIDTVVAMPLSMTTRAVGFLSQDFFPPGIDRDSLDKPIVPGPLFEGPDFAYQRRLLTEPGLPAYGNGITIFPGGIALYKNGELVGAIGISGDGVDQDDLICYAGTIGFEPPASYRCDNFSYDHVRLPFIKIPRQPEL